MHGKIKSRNKRLHFILSKLPGINFGRDLLVYLLPSADWKCLAKCNTVKNNNDIHKTGGPVARLLLFVTLFAIQKSNGTNDKSSNDHSAEASTNEKASLLKATQTSNFSATSLPTTSSCCLAISGRSATSSVNTPSS